MTLRRLPFDKAVRDMVATATGRPCGLYSIPLVPGPTAGSQVPATEPYSVLYALPATYDGPPFGDDHADVEWGYQLTAVALRADQAVWLHDRQLGAVLDRNPADPQQFLHPVTVTGMSVIRRRADDESPMDSERDVVSYPQRVTFTVTPA